ncbi:MAG: hypothetical protein ACRCV6_09635 [Formosimonas sp.]
MRILTFVLCLLCSLTRLALAQGEVVYHAQMAQLIDAQTPQVFSRSQTYSAAHIKRIWRDALGDFTPMTRPQTIHEQWQYRQKGHLQHISVTYQLGQSEFHEEYWLAHRALFRAIDSEVAHFNSTDEARTLKIDYTIKAGQIIDMTSLGHGKTEQDGWEPDILPRYKARITQLQHLIRHSKGQQ